MSDEAISGSAEKDLNLESEVRPILSDNWFDGARVNSGDMILREAMPIEKRDPSKLSSLDDLLKDDNILEEVTAAAKIGISTSRDRARETLDFYIGMGKGEIHSAMRTDPVIKALYDCAVQALTTYDLALSKMKGISLDD